MGRISQSPVVDMIGIFVVLVALYWFSSNAQADLFLMPSYSILVFISLLDSLFLGLLGELDFRVVLVGCLLFFSIVFGFVTYRIRTWRYVNHLH